MNAAAHRNEAILTVVLLGVGIYFSILLIRGFAGYLRFRRVRRTAVLTWPVPRPAHLPLLFSLGLLAAGVTVLNGYMARPLHHLYGLAVTALYFILMVPLSARIHLGFYREGIWADAGFLPYGKIGRWAFRETPEIVLILVSKARSRSFRLIVPASEYGAVRKVFEDKVRAHVVNAETAILGL